MRKYFYPLIASLFFSFVLLGQDLSEPIVSITPLESDAHEIESVDYDFSSLESFMNSLEIDSSIISAIKKHFGAFINRRDKQEVVIFINDEVFKRSQPNYIVKNSESNVTLFIPKKFLEGKNYQLSYFNLYPSGHRLAYQSKIDQGNSKMWTDYLVVVDKKYIYPADWGLNVLDGHVIRDILEGQSLTFDPYKLSNVNSESNAIRPVNLAFTVDY